MSKLFFLLLLPALCLAQTSTPGLNNQSTTTTQTGNLTVNLGTGTAVITDNGGRVITVTVEVDPRWDAMRAGLKQCSDAILSVQPALVLLLNQAPTVAQGWWRDPLTLAKPKLDAAKANADTYLTP